MPKRFSVRFSKSAERQILKLPKTVANRIAEKIVLLTDFPDVHLDILPVAGEINVYRLRIGDYRVLFTVFWEERVITITRIAKRSVAYR